MYIRLSQVLYSLLDIFIIPNSILENFIYKKELIYMNKETIDILGLHFTKKNFNDMIGIISERIHEHKKSFIVTANPEIVMHSLEDEEYRQVLDKADYIVPDGIGIIIASKIVGSPLKERVTGYDLMISLLQKADKDGLSIFLLGGQEEINDEAANNIRNTYSNVKIVGQQHGFFDLNDPQMAEKIEQLSPDIIFVALGFPRQEKWIGQHYSTFTKGIFIGVGGSIDVLSGRVKRAPVIWQKMKVEWLYRLIKQPSRWRRMLALPRFMLSVLKPKKNKK